MIKLNKLQINDLQSGLLQPEDLIMELIRKYSSYELAESLVSFYIVSPKSFADVDKVVLTEEQLHSFFKVKNPDEKRGRPKKIKEEN